MKNMLLTIGLAAATLTTSAVPPTVQGIPYKAKGNAAASDYLSPDPIPASEFDMETIEFWAGSGSKRCAVVIQWSDDSEKEALVFGYRWDGTTTGAEAIQAIVRDHPQVYGTFGSGQYGLTVEGIGFDPDGDGNFSVTTKDGTIVQPGSDAIVQLTEAQSDGTKATNANDYFHSGWYEGYWSYWTSDPGSDYFDYSQVGASSHQLEDGCIEGWMWAPGLQTGKWKPWKPASAPKDPTPPTPPDPQGPWTGDMQFNECGITYTVTDADRLTLAVSSAVGTYYTPVIVVPETVVHEGRRFKVTSFGENAVRYSTQVEHIYLPASLTSIGANAMNGNIKTITLQGTTVPECHKTAFASAPENITVTVPSEAVDAYKADDQWGKYEINPITAGCILEHGGFMYKIESIGDTDNAIVSFFPGWFLTSPGNEKHYVGKMEIPSKVTLAGREFNVVGVDANAFNSSVKLTGITLPESVKSIGEYAFSSCWELAEVNLPESLETMGQYAFAYCKALQTIHIPGSVETIPDYGFNECPSLESITGMENVSTIGGTAFMGCTALKSISGLSKLVEIGRFAFAGAESLEELPPMPSLRKIGQSAFTECYSLKYVCMPASMESVSFIFDTRSNTDVKVYFCGTTPFTLNGLHDFSYLYDSETGKDHFAPIYVPYGHQSTFANTKRWNYSEIRELTPMAEIIADDVETNGTDAVFSASFGHKGIAETDVPELFLAANDFSGHTEGVAAAAILEYRKEGSAESLTTAPAADGTEVSATVRNLADGNYEYRWISGPEGQYAASEWKPFCIQAVSVGISNIEKDAYATVYYNLQGMRVDNPGKGVYIQRKGSKSMKVTIK